jgi:lycopene cyclase domain-containing protein
MSDHLTYIILELGWALPPIVLQWLVGWRLLQRERRAWLLGILIPTVYLALADSTALGVVWTISPAKSLGIFVGNVPVEEIAFFLLTNTLVVQSVVLASKYRLLVQNWRQRVRTVSTSSGLGAVSSGKEAE